MRTKFEITKADAANFWILTYPDAFDEHTNYRMFPTFAQTVAAFIQASEAQCPICLRGAVVDTDWGWECEACGSYDVAVGCQAPR